MSKSVLFVDSKVKDYETLLASLGSDVEVYLLNADEDGVLQMADILKGRTGLDSIQIISHGSSGALALGSGFLNNDNVLFYANTLGQIGSTLSATGDILLYGCDVAAGDLGLSFINQLSAMTDADVAASDNLTGYKGDWTLESVTGQIESPSVITATAQQQYQSTLAVGDSLFSSIQFGTSSVDQVYGLIADNNQSVYVTGQTTGSFAGNSNLGENDAFIAKYDKLGNQVWARQIGTSLNDFGYSVSLDNDGNLYVSGQTVGSLPDNTDLGQADAFLAKYDSLGNQLWIKQFGSSQWSGAGADSANSVNVDTNGNIYTTGGVYGGDAYIVKYDSSGTQLWTKQVGTSNGKGNGIITDSNGDFYATGNAVGNLAGNVNQGLTDAYITKYDSLGNQVWAKLLGTSASDFSNTIAKDSNNNLYIGGLTSGSLSGNISQGGQDAFVAKYDGLGNQVWVKQFGTSGTDNITAIQADSNGNIYVVGSTDGALSGNINQGGQDAFLAKYDTLGNQVWIKQFGTASSDLASSISISNGLIYVAGSTSGNLLGNTNIGQSDGFIIGFDENGNLINQPPTATNLNTGETYTEDTALNLTDIVVSDVDSASVTARLIKRRAFKFCIRR